MRRRQVLSLTAVLLAINGAIAAFACGGGGGSGPELTDRLLVVRDTGIFGLDLETGKEQLLIPDMENALVADPVISPDGTRIAYAALLQGIVLPDQPEPDFGADVYVANVDGSDPHMVYQHQARGEQVRTPAWFGDDKLLISVQRFEQSGSFIAQIRELQLASGESSVLIDKAVQASPSKDLSKITYVSIDDSGLQSLWVSDGDGKNPRELGASDQPMAIIISPRFSPDGTEIVFGAGENVLPSAVGPEAGREFASRQLGHIFTQPRAALFYDGIPSDIWLMDVATAQANKIADSNADQPSLAWSGDGLSIFALDTNGVFWLDPAGKVKPKKLAEGTFHGQLDWLSAGPAGTPEP